MVFEILLLSGAVAAMGAAVIGLIGRRGAHVRLEVAVLTGVGLTLLSGPPGAVKRPQRSP